MRLRYEAEISSISQLPYVTGQPHLRLNWLYVAPGLGWNEFDTPDLNPPSRFSSPAFYLCITEKYCSLPWLSDPLMLQCYVISKHCTKLTQTRQCCPSHTVVNICRSYTGCSGCGMSISMPTSATKNKLVWNHSLNLDIVLMQQSVTAAGI